MKFWPLIFQNEIIHNSGAVFDAGSSSEAELGNFRMTVEQAQLDADRAAEDFSYTKRVFTRLVGIDDLDDDSIPIMVPHPKYSKPMADAILAGFVGDGIESTFQNQVYQMTLKQTDLNYSIANVMLLPKFGASATYAYNNYVQAGSGFVQQVALQVETYAVTATWSIFDGFANRGAKLSARESKRYFERLRKTYVDSTIDISHLHAPPARLLVALHVDRRGRYNASIGAEVKRLGDDVGLGYASQASTDSGKLTLYASDYQMAYARADFLGRWTEYISQAGIDPALANISPRYVR